MGIPRPHGGSFLRYMDFLYPLQREKVSETIGVTKETDTKQSQLDFMAYHMELF